MSSTELTRAVAEGAFLTELRLRLAEAHATLQAAEALEEPLLAQIAEADLADLRSLAARNDVALEAVSPA